MFFERFKVKMYFLFRRERRPNPNSQERRQPAHEDRRQTDKSEQANAQRRPSYPARTQQAGHPPHNTDRPEHMRAPFT